MPCGNIAQQIWDAIVLILAGQDDVTTLQHCGPRLSFNRLVLALVNPDVRVISFQPGVFYSPGPHSQWPVDCISHSCRHIVFSSDGEVNSIQMTTLVEGDQMAPLRCFSHMKISARKPSFFVSPWRGASRHQGLTESFSPQPPLTLEGSLVLWELYIYSPPYSQTGVLSPVAGAVLV